MTDRSLLWRCQESCFECYILLRKKWKIRRVCFETILTYGSFPSSGTVQYSKYGTQLYKQQQQIKLGWALFVTYTIIQSIVRSEMCSLHLTHPSVHTWSSGQPTVQRPGSSHGLPVGAGIRTHNLGLPRVSSPTRYPLGQQLHVALCRFPLSEVVNCTNIANCTLTTFWYPSVGVPSTAKSTKSMELNSLQDIDWLTFAWCKGIKLLLHLVCSAVHECRPYLHGAQSQTHKKITV